MRIPIIILLGVLVLSSIHVRSQTPPQSPPSVHQIFVEDQTDQPTHTPRIDPSPELLQAFDDRAAARRAVLHPCSPAVK
ncbi:hypothetical protein ACPOL_2807 [Acidisarcina polymorpha]|uniref:Uncharacterized protein n=1 Tax=Acidisarcina polymorpha TaxID=2211140 RepID=A0A2Z5G0F1_9BACT|nr:hypothetical protein [Acidisarcina polymorpha]AXC12115.1 hypothetical protein ACPOL_2807 [Acidisarcina polymorpha]